MRVLRVGVPAMLVVGVLTIAACGGGDDEEGSNASSSGQGSSKTVTVKLLQPVPGGVSSFFYPAYVGEELGYFADEKIKVDVQTASGDLPIPAFVQNGDTDVGAAGADETLQGVAQGGKYKVVFDYYTKAGDTISVPAGSGITDLKQLEGKTIGLANQDDRVFVETALQLAGADKSTVKMASVGQAGPTVASSLKSGKIAAYASGISDAAVLKATGIDTEQVLPEDIVGRPSASFLVSQKMIDEQPDVLERFLRAWAKSTYAGISDPATLEKMARKTLPQEFENEEVGKALLAQAVDSQTPEDGAEFGTIREDAWAATQDQLLDADTLSKKVDIGPLFDTKFLTAANDWDEAEVEKDVKDWAASN